MIASRKSAISKKRLCLARRIGCTNKPNLAQMNLPCHTCCHYEEVSGMLAASYPAAYAGTVWVPVGLQIPGIRDTSLFAAIQLQCKPKGCQHAKGIRLITMQKSWKLRRDTNFSRPLYRQIHLLDLESHHRSQAPLIALLLSLRGTQ